MIALVMQQVKGGINVVPHHPDLSALRPRWAVGSIVIVQPPCLAAPASLLGTFGAVLSQ